MYSSERRVDSEQVAGIKERIAALNKQLRTLNREFKERHDRGDVVGHQDPMLAQRKKLRAEVTTLNKQYHPLRKKVSAPKSQLSFV